METSELPKDTLFVPIRKADSSRPLLARLRPVVANPIWSYWVGLLLAFSVLCIRLAAAGDTTLQFWFNSDYLFPAHVYQDIAIDHFPVSGIKFSIAPDIFPDVVCTSVLMSLTRNAILATTYYGLLQFAFLVSAYLVCASVIGTSTKSRREKWVMQACIMTTAIAVVLYTAFIIKRPYDTLYYLFLDTSHVGSFAMVVFCGATSIRLCFVPLKGRHTIMLAVAVALTAIGTANNLMFVPNMLVPFSVVVLVMMFLNLMPARTPWMILIGLWGSGMAGIGLVRTCVDSAELSTQAGGGVDRFTAALNTYIKGLYQKCLDGDWLHFSAALWLVSGSIVVLILIRRYIVLHATFGEMPEKTRRVVALVLYLLTSALASAVSIIVLGIQGLAEFKDYWWSMHYQYPLFFGSVFGVALLAGWALSSSATVMALRRLRWVAGTIAVMVPLGVLLASPKAPVALAEYRPPLVRALDELGREYGLKYGVGGYWQARWVNLLSRNGLRVYPVTGSLDPFHWLGNKYWYSGSPGSTHPNPAYDFAVLDDPLWKIDRKAVVARFGEPAAEATAAGTRVLIYNRPSDGKFREFFRCSMVSSPNLLNRVGTKVEIPGSCLPGQVGTIAEHARTGRHGETSGGYLAYGPYLSLKPGTYSFLLKCRTAGPVGVETGTWDLGFFERGPSRDIRIGEGKLLNGQTDIRVSATVPPEASGRLLEMRVLYNGLGDIVIDGLGVERTR